MFFYVYRLFDLSGETLYVGKGCNYRLASQKRRFGLLGEKVKEFESERAAYAYEKRLIGKLKPRLNRHPGGAGGRFGHIREGMTASELWFRSIARCIRGWTFLGRKISKDELGRMLSQGIHQLGLERVREGLRPYNITIADPPSA